MITSKKATQPLTASFSQIDLKGVAITACIDPQGNFHPVNDDSLLDKIQAAKQDVLSPIHAIVIAQEQSIDLTSRESQLGMEEKRKFFSQDNPEFENSFYHFPNRHGSIRQNDFWVIRATSLADAGNKLHAMQNARWPDIDSRLDRRNPDFTGRDRLFQKVKDFMQEEKGGYLVVSGEMGRGKTTFMTELVYRAIDNCVENQSLPWDQRNHEFGTELPVYHFVGTENLSKSHDGIAKTLADQLRRNFGLFPNEEAYISVVAKYQELLRQLSDDFMIASDGKTQFIRKQLLIIDAADQAGEDAGKLMSGVLTKLPNGFYCIITTRPDTEKWNDSQTDTCISHLKDLTDDRKDIRAYLEHLRERKDELKEFSNLLIEQIVDNREQSEPIFFTIRKRIDELCDSRTSRQRKDELLSSEAVSEQWFTGVKALVEKELSALKSELENRYKIDPTETMAVLGCLASVSETLTKEQFKKILRNTDLEQSHIDKVVLHGRNLFVSEFSGKANEPLVFGHPQYGRAILGELTDEEERECHERLANGCDNWKRVPPKLGQAYCLKYRIVHWLRALTSLEESWLPVARIFADMEYVVNRSERDGFDDFAGLYEDAREAMKIANEKKEGADWGDWPQAFQDWERFLRWRLEFFRGNSRMYPQEIVNEFHSQQKCFVDLLQKSARKFLKKCFWLKKTTKTNTYQPAGHSSFVNCLAISSKKDLIASGDICGMIKIWDVKTGQLEYDFRGHVDKVNAVSFSTDGRYVVSGSDDHTVKIWDTETGELKQNCQEHIGRVTSVSFSPDGRHSVSGGEDHAVIIWDVKTGKLKNVCRKHNDKVNVVSFSEDGRFVVSGDDGGTVNIWDAKTGELKWECQESVSGVISVSISKDGERVISGCWDEDVIEWDTDSGQVLHGFLGFEGQTGRMTSLSFSSDGLSIVSGSDDGSVKIWDVETGKLKQVCQGNKSHVHSVSFSPDGCRVASGNSDYSIKIWDVKTGELEQNCIGHTDVINSILFSSDNCLVVSGSDDKTVKIWDVKTGELKHDCQGNESHIHYVSFSPDGRYAVSGSDSVKIWDLGTGKLKWKRDEHAYNVNAVSFSPDSRYFVLGCKGGMVKVWDIETKECIRDCHRHTESVSSVAFSSNGHFVVSGDVEGTVMICQAKTGELKHVCRRYEGNISSVLFSPDDYQVVSRRIRCQENIVVEFWNVETGVLKQDCYGCECGVESIVLFSSDGRHVVSGWLDNSLKIRDAKTGQLLHDYRGHTSVVNSISSSLNGRHIASADSSGKVFVWNITLKNTVGVELNEHYLLGENAITISKPYLISVGDDQMLKVWPWPTGGVSKVDSLATLFFSSNPAGAHLVESTSSDQPSRLHVVLESGNIFTYEINVPGVS